MDTNYSSDRPASFYRPELDGLRFLAFFAVLIHHAVPNHPIPSLEPHSAELAQWIAALTRAAGFGTDLFFALSAYLITELLLREQAAYGRLDVPRFYVRRILRIWPLYFLFLAGALFVLPRFQPNVGMSAPYQVSFLLFGANWAFALWGYPHSPASPLWSISIEEQFYLVWPLILLRVPTTKLSQVAFWMIGISMTSRIVVAVLGVTEGFSWFSTLTRLDGIACGLLAATVFESAKFKLSVKTWWVLAFAGLVLVMLFERYVPRRWFPILSFPIAAATCLSILRGVLGLGQLGWLARPPFAYLGKISYGLYVFHLLALSGATKLVPWAAPEIYYTERLLLTFAITIVLGTASFYLVERPFLKLKSRFARVESRPVG